jgi:hypothetical protein
MFFDSDTRVLPFHLLFGVESKLPDEFKADALSAMYLPHCRLTLCLMNWVAQNKKW